jgi:hypothetical protein
MEVSNTSMKAASATVMAMSQGLTLGFQRGGWGGYGLSMCCIAA